MDRPRLGTTALLAVPAGLVGLIVAPLLRPGYVLSYDMVFVPRQPFTEAMFGLGGGAPRAVPSDFVVGLAARVLPGDVVQKIVLAGILLGAAYGVMALLREAPVPVPSIARVSAAGFYLWNAYVYERLLLGHWALLLGYAALPWVVRGALRMRQDRPRAGRETALGLAVAAIGGFAAGVIVSVVAVVVVAWPSPGQARRRVRQAGLILAAGLLVNAPWLLPSLLRPGGVPSDPVGVGAFAARADTALGTLGSLLALGGVWNAEVAPPGRDSAAVALAALAVLAVVVAGLPRLPGCLGRDGTAALTAVALGGLILAAAPQLPGLRTVAEYLVVHVPGGGVLRDSQKYVLPLALLEALAFGLGAARLTAAAARQPAPVGTALARTGAVLAVLAPLAVLPALAFGAAGQLRSVSYPADWSEAREIVAADPVPGAVAVLPWHLYREFPWNRGRPTLDPAPRFFDRPVVVNDTLELADRTVRGEDAWARRLDPLVREGGPATEPLPAALAAHRVRYVLVERTQPGAAEAERRLAGAEAVLAGPELALYRLTGPSGAPPAAAPALPVLLADALAAAGFLGLFLSLLLVPYRGSSHRADNASVHSAGVRD